MTTTTTIHENKVTYSCGHTRVDRCSVPAHPTTVGFACAKCREKRDRQIDKLARKLTGSAPESSGGRSVLRWRLMATEAEVSSAFIAAGLDLYFDLLRDSGDDAAAEQSRHSSALRMMQTGRRRCACGSWGTWSETVSGTIGDHPAIWACCENCSGSAVGGGIAGSDLHRVVEAIDAANRCEADIDAWVDAGILQTK